MNFQNKVLRFQAKTFWMCLGWLVIALMCLTGCDLVNSLRSPSPQQSITPALPTESQFATPTAALVTPTPSGPMTLRIWLPPGFDPDSGSRAGTLLKQRLEEFAMQNPGVVLDIRLKDIKGPGGLLEALETAGAAAHSALPDLVIIPSEHLERVARQGLLSPLNDLSSALENNDWFNFARSMAEVKEQIYGLPIAADALIRVYQRDKDFQPATDWTGFLDNQRPALFAAADMNAWFPLALYLGSTGEVRDDQGRLILEINHLVDVLTFFEQGRKADIMPAWLADIQQDEQAWEAYQQQKNNQVITWSSDYLNRASGVEGATSLPSANGEPLSYGNGWVWALTSPDATRHPISVKLAEFMIESSFLARWSEALGIIPARPSALQKWTKTGMASQIEPIARALQPFPPAEVVNSLGPLLAQATIKVLKSESEPLPAAQAAVQGLK